MADLEGVRNFQKSIAEDVYPDGWKGTCTICGKPFSYTKEECVQYLTHGWPKCDHKYPPVEKKDPHAVVLKSTSSLSSVIGRNGSYYITQIRLQSYPGRGKEDGMLSFDAVGKRGYILNAGFFINTNSFIELAKEFLENNGYTVKLKESK